MNKQQQQVAHWYLKNRQGYKQPALVAFYSAKSMVFFLERLKKEKANYVKRSRAAKKGWKARKAA